MHWQRKNIIKRISCIYVIQQHQEPKNWHGIQWSLFNLLLLFEKYDNIRFCDEERAAIGLENNEIIKKLL